MEDSKDPKVDQAAQTVMRLAMEKGPEVKRIVDDLKGKNRDDKATTKRNIKLVLGATGVVVVGIGVMTLLAKLWFYFIALAVLGGVGLAGYLAVRPKLRALGAARAQRQLVARQQAEAAAREKATHDAARAAQQAKEDQARQLEDQLAALKKKL